MITKQPARTGPMNKAEAQAITDRIRGHIDAAWSDIERAFEGKAWKALGYASWGSYVRDEFDMSRRHSYRLIDQARVIHEIAKAAGEDVTHGSQIPERVAREIKADLPAVTAEIKQRVEAGEEPAKAVAETVAAARETKQEKTVPPGAEKPAPKTAAPRVDVEALQAELEEVKEERDALRADVAKMKAELAKFEDMKLEYERGGFAEIIANKDETIRVLQSRVASESAEKVKNLRDLRGMAKKLDEAGKGRDIYIDLDEAANG